MTPTTPTLVPFDLAAIAPEDDAPPAEKILAGQPTNRTWIVDESVDGKTITGVWESTPGSWRASYDEWEFCSILSGAVVLHPDGEPSRRLGPGDSFVIRPGFDGVWEVIETVRKLFVIRLP